MRSRLGIYAQQRPPFEVPALTGGQASSSHHPRDGISLFVTRRELQQCHSTGQQVPEDGRQAFPGHRQTIRTTVDRAHRILRKLLGLFMRHPRGIGDDQREPLVCAQDVCRPPSPAVDPQAGSPGVARGVLGGRRVYVDADEAPAGVGHRQQADLARAATQFQNVARGQVRQQRGCPPGLCLRPWPGGSATGSRT